MILFVSIAAVGILLLLGILCAFIWRVVVETNMVHIVQSSKKTVSYGRGQAAGNTYYEFPSFLPIVGVTVTRLPESVFPINLKDYESYDINRLPFVVDIAAFFRIADSQMAAQRVANFTELTQQLTSILQGTARRILATNNLENIMQERASLGDQFTHEVDDQLKEWGVGTVKMIEIMDLRDSNGSQVIANIMAKDKSRIEMESRSTVAENIKVAQEKEIEAQREVDLRKTEAKQVVGIRQAEADKEVGIAQEKSNQEVQSQAKVTADREMDVERVKTVRQAEISKEAAIVKAEEDKSVQIVTAEAAKEAQIISADAEKEAKIRIAEGDLQSTLKDSEGTLALGTAEAEAERLKLHAPVSAQLTLAKEIGENQAYQTYLIEVRKVEATEVIGKEMAGAMKEAELKVIANSGSVQNGVASLGDIFTPSGGTSIAGMLEALAQTDQGKAVLDKVVGTTQEKTTKKRQ